ncbi:hypothetical protein K8S19_04465 [bacterium]|nr:hypothetical protein [bacterium]
MLIYSAAYCTNNEIGRMGETGKKLSEKPGTLPKWAQVFSSVYERYPRLDPFSQGVAILVEKMLGRPPVKENIGVVLATATGCLEADQEYYRSAVASPELASPKLFPYTLPSAGLAEVMIRYGMTGPALVMWQEKALAPMISQIKHWIENQEIDSGIIVSCDIGLLHGMEGFALHIGPEVRDQPLLDIRAYSTQDMLAAILAGKIVSRND